jgi:hypothetical protein
MFCKNCGNKLESTQGNFCTECGATCDSGTQQLQAQPQANAVMNGGQLIRVVGKPSIAGDLIILIINIIIDISLLLSGSFIWFLILVIFTIFPAVRLINTLNSGIFVGDTGVSGKIKNESFEIAYNRISSASTPEKDYGKNLLIVAGYKTYSINVRNAAEIRDAISHNMAVLGVIPAPVETGGAENQ